jgi:hypothetical protein
MMRRKVRAQRGGRGSLIEKRSIKVVKMCQVLLKARLIGLLQSAATFHGPRDTILYLKNIFLV